MTRWLTQLTAWSLRSIASSRPGQHHLAQRAVDEVAVRVDVGEVVVLADDLELLERRLERPVVPQAGVGEGVRLVDDRLGGERRRARVAALVPLVQPEREPRHRDVVPDVPLLLGELVGVDRQALDRLRVDATEDERRREPHDDDGAERPHPRGEGARDQQRARHAREQREHVVGEEPRVGVRVADARDRAPGEGAVDEVVLVELVAERDRQQVQAGDHREVDPHAGHEHLAARASPGRGSARRRPRARRAAARSPAPGRTGRTAGRTGRS